MDVHTYPKVISPKINVMARLEFELSYDDVEVQHMSHNATRVPTDK